MKMRFKFWFRSAASAAAAMLLAGCGGDRFDCVPEEADLVAVLNGSRIAAQPQVHQMIGFLTMTAPGFDGRLDRELAKAGISANDFKNEYILFYNIATQSGGGAALTPAGVAPKLFQAFRRVYRRTAADAEFNGAPGFVVKLPEGRGRLKCALISDRRLEFVWGGDADLPLTRGHRNRLVRQLNTQSALLHVFATPGVLLRREPEKIPTFLARLETVSFQLLCRNGVLTQEVTLEFDAPSCAPSCAYEAKGAAETLLSTVGALLPVQLPIRLDRNRLQISGASLQFTGEFSGSRLFAAEAHPSRRNVTSASNLKRFAAAAMLYADRNDGFWPPDADHLRTAGLLTDPAALIAPCDLSIQPSEDGTFHPENMSYLYFAGNLQVRGIPRSKRGCYPIACEKPELRPGAECAVLWLDGSVSYHVLNAAGARETVRQLLGLRGAEEDSTARQLENNAALLDAAPR